MAVNTARPPAAQPRQNTPREVVPPPAPEPTRAPEPDAEPAPKAERAPRPEPKPRKQSTWSIFSLVERVVNVDGLFRDGVPVRFLPHTLFVMFLILVYIGNTHYAARMNRSIQRLKTETEDLRADYTTLSADYMEASKQSEVARKVAAYGLVESSSPPFSIKVPAGGLEEARLDELPVLTADSIAAQAVRDSLAAAATAPVLPAAEPETAPEAEPQH
ncbi:FtsL-like putative cell division protein [Hymenobacter jeollabukensis]|uniref:FtsL-like putative cell division protein n=1 Tax=Hymenobacter jeollabukensis TaxID=2025313 RepID=UPI0026D5E222|nr:FtsL-like putative cell division protein [Hymenobacter jeollabukensis]